MQGGGAERVAALLCNQWVRQGHAVTLMPTFSGRGDCLYPLDERVKLDYLADRVNINRPLLNNKFHRFIMLRSVIREIRPDIILSFLTHVNVAAIISSLGLKVSVVVSERTYPPAMPLGFLLTLARKWLYPFAKSVVVQTEVTKSWLSGYSPRINAVVIPNPIIWPFPEVDRNTKTNFVVSDKAKIVLAVGRLGEEKGFDVLIQAFAEIASLQIEWHLVIVGEGSERKKLEQLVGQLGLDDRISLPGRTDNVSAWYQQADLFVLSSRFEGFPNALLEAMAHGVPAVSFDCQTGPSDIIQNGVNGMLVAPENGASGLAKALSSLMTDGSLREKLGQQATNVRERYAIEKIAAQWDKVLFGHRP